VLAAGVAPVEVASVAFTGLAGGEVAIAAGLLVASTLLTVLLAGPVLALLGAHAATSQLGLLLTLVLVVALPLVAGCALRTIDPFGGRERPLIEILGTASLLVLLWEVASELRLQAGDGVVALALLAYLGGAVGLGWLLALRAPSPRRIAVILPTAMRDFAVAAGIAASAFGIAAAAPLGIYGVMVLVFGAIAVQASKRGWRTGVSKSARHDPYQSTARPAEVPVSADEGIH
jgi:predicted Na+-dependent transporter